MGSSQHTPTVYLPVFVATDKPTWMGDFNDAMNKIDSAFLNRDNNYVALSNRLTADEANITVLQGEMSTANASIVTLQTDDASHTASIVGLTTSVGTINTHLSTIDGEIGTITGEITTIQTNQATDETNIAGNTASIASQGSTIASHTAELASHAAELATHQNVISQINWQILSAGTDSDTTNSSGEVGVYHEFGVVPAAIKLEVIGAGSNLFHSVHTYDQHHFIARFENSDGTPYVGAVVFFYIVIG